MKKTTLQNPKDVPDIYFDRMARISPEERVQLRQLITNPLYLKMLRAVAALKPSSNCVDAGSMKRDEFSDARANARLGEIRGWEWYEFCIFQVLNEPKPAKAEAEMNYPAEGMPATEPKIP